MGAVVRGPHDSMGPQKIYHRAPQRLNTAL